MSDGTFPANSICAREHRKVRISTCGRRDRVCSAQRLRLVAGENSARWYSAWGATVRASRQHYAASESLSSPRSLAFVPYLHEEAFAVLLTAAQRW
jgi:hypothetical protein